MTSDSRDASLRSPADAHAHPRKKVLVVDDGRSAADVLALFFEMEGMETAVAYDGETAVAIAAEFQPDLVCMDLGLPHMDGYEAGRLLRNLLDRAVLIALSGWGREEDKRRTAEAGFDDHLVKPVSPADLRALVARYLNK